MKIQHLIAFLLAIGLVLAPASAYSKGRAPAPAKKEPPKPNHSTVTAISDTSITVSTKNGAQTYTIGPFTEIRVNGVKAKASEIQVGMIAMVGADSSKKATSITASPGPKEEPTKKK